MGHREPSSAAGWRLEDSADEPQCTAWSMVRNLAGRRKNLLAAPSKLDATASGRGSCIAMASNPSSRGKL